jgi:predicted dinucleotide-binding enzyme
MIQPLTIGVLGSGPTGQTLAKVFLEHGHPVMIGSRDPAKLLDWLSDAGAQAHFGTFTETPSLASWAFWSASEDSTARIGGEVLSVGHGASECRKCVSLDPYIECVSCISA